MAERIRGINVPRKVIVCSVCGIEANRVHLEGKPWLEVDALTFTKACVEQSLAPEPFRCPNLFFAAMDARWIGRDGSWIESLDDSASP
jgi:hypothetical protein